MSVKDKIAMWNSMATAPAPPPAPKLAVSANNPPPKEQPKEKLPPSHPPHQSTLPPAVTSTSFKKTESIELHSPSLPTQTEHTSPPVEKPKPAVTIPVVEKQEKKQEGGGHEPAKFSDIKKQLEAQTAGKGIYFAPPPKKIEVVAGDGGGGECEVQKDVPLCSVKEQAAKLAVFYLQKHQNELKKKQEQETASNDHHEVPPPSPSVPPADNCLNITPPEPSHEQKEPQTTGLTLRVQKNKKKREQFQDDDD